MEKVKITIVIETETENKDLLTKEYLMKGIKIGFTDISENEVNIKVE